MKRNTITVARNLAYHLNQVGNFTYVASGKFDQITVLVKGFGAPILHNFKTRKEQCDWLQARIDEYANGGDQPWATTVADDEAQEAADEQRSHLGRA